MATTAQQVFELTMHLMEAANDSTGQADTADTREYKNRTLPLLNVLRVECFPASDTYAAGETGKRAVCPMIADFTSAIPLDDVICQGVLPYGLAAHLLLDENPDMAVFFQQRYEQALLQAKRSRPTAAEDIEDIYGGIEHGRHAWW